MKNAILISLLLSVSFTHLTGCSSSSDADKEIEKELGSDTTPDNFNFSDLVDAEVGIELESNTVSITGIDTDTEISISNGEYKIHNSDNSFTSDNGLISPADSVSVRLISSAEYGSETSLTLTIGDVSANFSITTMAQPVSETIVDINLNTKHTRGTSSHFDRSKFITYHASVGDNEWPDETFRNEFLTSNDVYLGRNNGALPWQMSRLKDTANGGLIDITKVKQFGGQTKGWYASDTTAHKHEHRADNMMFGGQPIMYPLLESGNTCKDPCKANTWLAGYDEYAKFYSNFLTHYFGTGGQTGEVKPKIIEVLNEPFVHSYELPTTNENISKLHKVVADKLHKDHPEVMVGGFTAAWPALERNNFSHWDSGWKTFIDVAGAEMDFYSIHLYDGYGDGEHEYRTGANIEAILDMIEQYSMLTTGEVKPWVISEYGFYAPSVSNSTPYSKLKDWYGIRSFSSIMMNLMERPDDIISAIPFTILKALWSGNNGIDSTGHRYGPRLLVLEGELDGSINVADDGNWVYSEFIKFYQLWSQVKGTRIETIASNIDIQVDSFVDNKTVYVALNNMEQTDKEVTLNLVEHKGNLIESINIKHLYWDEAIQSPILADFNVSTDTREIVVGADSTLIAQIEYSQAIDIDQNVQEYKYYSDRYKQAISTQPVIFNINELPIAGNHSEATLRIGLNRLHSASLKPNLTVNGTRVSVPNNFRGYEQKSRDSFFGVIDVPIPSNILRDNNKIEMTFDTAGGVVSSVTLQVLEFDHEVTRSFN